MISPTVEATINTSSKTGIGSGMNELTAKMSSLSQIGRRMYTRAKTINIITAITI
jgi:hypothetical protein